MDAILDHAGAASTPVVRTLRSKWMIARVYEGQPHEPLIAVARELYDGGRLVDEAGLWSQAATHVAAALSYGDDYAAAEEVLARARAESQRRGWLTPLAAASQLRARLRLWTGSIPDVVADAETAVEIFSSGQQMYVPASAYCLARGLIESDRLDDAERALARVEADGPPDGIFAAWHHEARGRLAAAAGDWARALNEFLACGARTEALLLGNPAMFHWRSEAGLAALRLGDGERARTLIEAERRRAERFGAPRAIGVARRAGALLARGDAVEEELHAAAALFELCGARVEHALGLVELGGAIRRAGRPGEARETLREALQIAMSVGAVRIARLAREELGRAGGRAPTAGRGVEALTPSERRVAELAAEGRTNREIANELFVTVKAVEWHLGNCYRKLDIRGRSGLAAALDVSTDGPSAATARSSPGP